MSASTFYVRRQGSLLVPWNEAAQDAIAELPLGTAMEAKIVRRRSARQVAMYQCLCNDVAKMLQAHGWDGETKEKVDARIRVATGHCFVTPLSASMAMAYGTRLMAVPGRIAFDKLDQTGMNRFMDGVTRFVLSELLPDLPASEWARRIEARLTQMDAAQQEVA